MRLLESQEKRTTRLFDNAFKALASGVPQGESAWPELRRHEFISWYAGGASAAESAVRKCEPLGNAWGRGDEQSAAHLAVVFTMPMILRFYGYSDALRTVEWRYLFAYSLNNLFELNPGLPLSTEPTGSEYLELAKQFEFDEHAKRLHYWIEMDYLLSAALALLRRPSEFSMDGVKLPVPDAIEFWRRGGVRGSLGSDLRAYYAMFAAVGRGFTTSMRVLRALRDDAERMSQ